MRFNGVRRLEFMNPCRIAVTKFVDCLVGVAHERDMYAVRSEPRQDLQIERIAILTFVHHDFVETCRQRATECPAIHWVTNQPQRLNAGVAGTHIACPQQATSPVRRRLLISDLMLAHMILQSGVSDPLWINDIGFRVEQI